MCERARAPSVELSPLSHSAACCCGGCTVAICVDMCVRQHLKEGVGTFTRAPTPEERRAVVEAVCDHLYRNGRFDVADAIMQVRAVVCVTTVALRC